MSFSFLPPFAMQVNTLRVTIMLERFRSQKKQTGSLKFFQFCENGKIKYIYINVPFKTGICQLLARVCALSKPAQE